MIKTLLILNLVFINGPWGQNNHYYHERKHSTNNRVYYFDEVRIATGDATYKDVVPE